MKKFENSAFENHDSFFSSQKDFFLSKVRKLYESLNNFQKLSYVEDFEKTKETDFYFHEKEKTEIFSVFSQKFFFERMFCFEKENSFKKVFIKDPKKELAILLMVYAFL